MYSLIVAHASIVASQAETVLVIGAETLSRITNWQDRSTCILFGDAAGAAVVRPAREGYGFLSFALGGNGAGADQLYLPAGGSRRPASFETVERKEHTIQMAGPEVYKFAVRTIPRAALEAIAKAGLRPEDIDFVIPHQANLRIIQSAAHWLRVPIEKFYINVQHYGNTSAASVPVALYEAVAADRVREGNGGVMVACGAGYTGGAGAMRWGGGA
jgi:3-oxoacyl-[acyl-carrier-protein] synthase-3